MRSKLLITILALSAVSLGFSADQPAKQVFGYYTNWDTYGRDYQPSAMPVDDMTAGLYAFAEIGNCAPPYATDSYPTRCNPNNQSTGEQDYKLHSTDPYSDFNTIPQGYLDAGESGKGNMSKFINVLHAQKKPALLSVGGYSLSVPFATAIDSTHRAAFITSIVDFLNTVKADNGGDGFDGVDIDWEPNDNQWSFLSESGASTILNNYIQFLTELKADLKSDYASYAWVTIAMPASPSVIAKANAVVPDFWKQTASIVEYFNVMAYDYHGAFDDPKITNFNAPLTYDSKQPANVLNRETFNVTSTISSYLGAQVPASKIVLGVPTYARALAGVEAGSDSNTPGLYQGFTGAYKGEWDDTGVYDYKYVLGHMLGNGYTDYNDSNAGQTAAYNPTEKVWLSYDSVNDIKRKAIFVKSKGLAGMMFWSLSGDIATSDPNYDSASLVHNAKVDMSGD